MDASSNRVADWLFCEADASRKPGTEDDAYGHAFADGIERALDLLGHRRDADAIPNRVRPCGCHRGDACDCGVSTIDAMSADWKDGYETGFAEASFGHAIPNSVASGDDSAHCPIAVSGPGHAPRNSAAEPTPEELEITVSPWGTTANPKHPGRATRNRVYISMVAGYDGFFIVGVFADAEDAKIAAEARSNDQHSAEVYEQTVGGDRGRSWYRNAHGWHEVPA